MYKSQHKRIMSETKDLAKKSDARHGRFLIAYFYSLCYNRSMDRLFKQMQFHRAGRFIAWAIRKAAYIRLSELVEVI